MHIAYCDRTICISPPTLTELITVTIVTIAKQIMKEYNRLKLNYLHLLIICFAGYQTKFQNKHFIVSQFRVYLKREQKLRKCPR